MPLGAPNDFRTDRLQRRAHATTATVPQTTWANAKGKLSSLFSLKMSIVTLCIMRLNRFYYKTSRAVHKQFIPNPSNTFKCTFPSSEQSVTAHLQWAGITFRFVLCTVKFMLWFLYQIPFLIASFSVPSVPIPLLQHPLLSLTFSAQGFSTHPVPLPCSWVHTAHRHSPWPCLPEKLILAGLGTPPVPGPPARPSEGPGDVSGMVPRAAVPSTPPMGLRALPALQQVCSRAGKAKVPVLLGHFCSLCFLKR